MAPRRWLLAGTLVILSTGAALLPMTARAAPPTMQTIPLDYRFTFPPNSFNNPCSFPLPGHVGGTLAITDYYDQSGNVTRELDRSPRTVITLTGPNGTSISTRTPAPAHTTFTSAGYVQSLTGVESDFHLPGDGKLFMITGNLTIAADFSTDPPTVNVTFDGLQFSDTSTFCTILSS